jgi:hypothetical protein
MRFFQGVILGVPLGAMIWAAVIAIIWVTCVLS